MEKEKLNIPWPGWEKVDTLGHGNFGTVYKIQRTTRGRTEYAALKVIRIPKEESEIANLRQNDYDDESITLYYEDCLNRIEDEYAMMAELKGYANIVYCDDYFSKRHEDGFGWDFYIKMELLTPFKTYLREVIPEEQVVALGIDICNALKRCEELNIVHRDIKPENIFVSKEGKYKLGDFGIARTMEGTTGGTKTGTFDYMAPEVSNNKDYHAKVDIYSLGMVMYWMLNERTGPFLPLGGKKPTPSMKQTAWDRRFAGEQIPAPKNGSAELQAIVLKACAYDPKDRYQSAQEMLNALTALKTGATPTVVPVVETPSNDSNPVTDAEEDDILTVGPSWSSTKKRTVEDDAKTVGPTWINTSTEIDEDVTVGPVFHKMGKTHTQTDTIEDEEQLCQKLRRRRQEVAQKQYARRKKNKRAVLVGVVVLLSVILLVLLLQIRGDSTHADSSSLEEENDRGIEFNADTTTQETVSSGGCRLVGHNWSASTCTEPRICKLCGEQDGNPLGHKWINANCTTPKTCSVCAATEGTPLFHQWEDATCIAPKTCKRCGQTEGSLLEHSWLVLNCTELIYCSFCGVTKESNMVHEWTEATLDAPKTCLVCFATEGEKMMLAEFFQFHDISMRIGESAYLTFSSYRALIEWTSSDSQIASVNDGIVTANTKGIATITAQYQDQTVDILIRVG